jgi:DNA-binding transcriptional LysR family regulator
MSERKSPSKTKTRSRTINPSSVAEALLVADHLSFRRAAGVLGIHQSAVSRRVRALEDELGVSLFERNHTGVRLTNAGTRFFQEARDALRQLESAVKAAATAGSGAIGRLSVGIRSSMATGYLRELMQVYRVQHPDIAVHVLEGASNEHIALIRRRRLDVAFVTDTTDATGCDTASLWNERLFVALPDDHVLGGKKEIEWQDLRNERLMLRESERDPALCDRLAQRLPGRNRNANVQKLNVDRETLMHLVAVGLGIGITSEATVAMPFRKVVFRPIAGKDELLQFCAAWLPHNDNPALRQFLSLARTMARSNR